MARKSSSKPDRHDYYEVLEVSRRARPSVIDAARRALAKDYQPRTDKDDCTRMKLINEAHEVLSDSEKRAEYDKHEAPADGDVIGNYKILEEIASGGFGTTYLAKHVLTDEFVCVKHCHHVGEIYADILVKEAKAVWDLRHYSLPVMRDLIKMDDGSFALVLSYIPGPTLEQLVNKAGKLDPEHVAWIAERILNALMYLHYNGVVHGDIKPQNVIIQPETHQLVLVDFGLSMVKPTSKSDPKGYTPVFSSPEQLAGEPLVPESDFYSLGMTMLYALSGSADAAARLSVPHNAPDPLCKFIKQLLVRNVRERPNWVKGNPYEEIQRVREASFGRRSSMMKPISGFTKS